MGLLVADCDGAPAGILWAAARGVTGWIVAFAVDPGCRRRGCGRALVDAGLAYLAGRGCQEVIASGYAPTYFRPGPDVEAHTDAVRLLRRAGVTVSEAVVAMACRMGRVPVPPAPRGVTVSALQPRLIVPVVEYC